MYKIDVKIMLTSNIHSLSSTRLDFLYTIIQSVVKLFQVFRHHKIQVFTKQSASLIVLLKF